MLPSDPHEAGRLLSDAFLHRWKAVLLTAILTMVAAVYGTANYEKPYKSTARVLVEDSTERNPFLEDLLVDWQVKDRTPVITNVLRSRVVAERMVRELELVSDDATPLELDDAIRRTQRNIHVFGLGAGIVQIDFSGESPEQSFHGIQILMEAFTDHMLSPQREALDESVEFLAGEVERVRGELHELEDEIRIFKEEHADELPDVYRLNLDVYLGLMNDLVESEAELAAFEMREAVALERLELYDPVTRQLEAELARARTEWEEAQAAYQPGHPRVQFAQSRVTQLEGQLRAALAEPNPVDLGALVGVATTSEPGAEPGGDSANLLLTGELLAHREAQGESAALQQRIAMLESRIQESRENVNSFAANEQILNGLLRDLEIKSDVYSELRARYEDALVTRELTMHEEASQVWVIDEPVRPPEREKIPPQIAAAGGFIGGLGLALGVVLLLEFLGTTVRTVSEAESLLDAPCLGRIGYVSRSMR